MYHDCKAPPTKGHLSYLARFQIHWDSKIPGTTTKLSFSREATSLIRPLFHGRRGGLLTKRKLRHWWTSIPSISTKQTTPLILTELTEHKKNNDIWHHKSRSWLGTKMCLFVCLVNTTFNNISVISWQSVLLVEETERHGENHQPVACHFITYCCTPRPDRDSNSKHQWW